jgi:hypothetical protein
MNYNPADLSIAIAGFCTTADPPAIPQATECGGIDRNQLLTISLARKFTNEALAFG